MNVDFDKEQSNNHQNYQHKISLDQIYLDCSANSCNIANIFQLKTCQVDDIKMTAKIITCLDKDVNYDEMLKREFENLR